MHKNQIKTQEGIGDIADTGIGKTTPSSAMFAKTAALLAFVAIATATDINVSDHGMPRTASPRQHRDEPSNVPVIVFPFGC